jgi:hypothetical protein
MLSITSLIRDAYAVRDTSLKLGDTPVYYSSTLTFSHALLTNHLQ